PTVPSTVNHPFTCSGISPVFESSRNFWRTPRMNWYTATPATTTPAAPINQRPAGQPKTSLAVLLAFPLPDVLGAVRICTATTHSNAYTIPLPQAATRSIPVAAGPP